MLLSDLLILSGPVTYIGCWVIVLLIIMFSKLDQSIKAGLLAYAAIPFGALTQTGSGVALAAIGL